MFPNDQLLFGKNSVLSNYANDNMLYCSGQNFENKKNLDIMISKRLQNGFMKTVWC